MTVGELRQLLEGVADDMRVVVYADGGRVGLVGTPARAHVRDESKHAHTYFAIEVVSAKSIENYGD